MNSRLSLGCVWWLAVVAVSVPGSSAKAMHFCARKSGVVVMRAQLNGLRARR